MLAKKLIKDETLLRTVPAAVRTVEGAPRAVAVAMFRDLADRLEAGDLDGARIQWRVGPGPIETVEMDPKRDGPRSIRFRRTVVKE